MSTFGKAVLYSYWQSSCTYRVRIAMNLKEIPYDMIAVDIRKGGGEQLRNKEFQEINPKQQIPVLKVDGQTFIESLNIMHYLEETRPQKPLMPQDFVKRARVREICEVIVSGIQPLQHTAVQKAIGEEKSLEWVQSVINKGFTAVEKLLKCSAGKYCVGDNITLADCCLIPQVYNARWRYKVDLRPFPTILRIDKELEKHPAFLAAHPSYQPDCPPEEAKKK